MKAIRDPDCLLAEGLSAIRAQFKVPAGFPPEVEAAAEAAARRPLSDHADWTDRAFVTLDPASSTDLDQAFAIEQGGGDLLLHYAIADVPWFVADGDPVDLEAWQRGMTTYLPDGKAGLYPKVLSEAAASLLPDGPRPAVVFTSRIGPQGKAVLQGVQRAVIRSRAKLAYDSVTPDQLPAQFVDLAARIAAAEERRGAARVDFRHDRGHPERGVEERENRQQRSDARERALILLYEAETKGIAPSEVLAAQGIPVQGVGREAYRS